MFSLLRKWDMHSKRLVVLTICAIILSSLFVVNTASAEDEMENLVEATFNIEFVTATEFHIEVTMDAQKLTLDETYTADEIKSASLEDIGVFKALLYQMLQRQLEGTFNGAEILNFTRPTFDGNKFNEELDIKLTASFFELNDSVNATNFINGILDIGALVNYTLNFYGEPGWNNTYLVDLGTTYNFQQTTGSKSGNNIVWTLKNWDGKTPNKDAFIQLNKTNPTTKKLESEDIFLELELDSRTQEATSLTSNVMLSGVDIRQYDALPSFVSNLDYAPADGVRLLIENGFFTWDDFYQKTVKTLEEKIKSTIENSPFNQTLDLTFIWDNDTASNCLIPYEISNMDDTPAIKAILEDNKVNLQLCGVSSRAFFGLINSGAKSNISRDDLNFGEDLNTIGYDFEIILYLPDKLYLDNKNIFTWNESSSIFGDFKSDIAANYNDQEKDMLIEIEVKSVDLNILSFLTGKTELKFELDSRETRNYNVTTIPEEFSLSLPKKISLDYLNSDAFRLCIEENIFDAVSVNTFLDKEKIIFESILRNILPGLDVSGNIKREIFDESLAWDGNISNMDAETPVKVANSAHTSYPINFELSVFPPKFGITTQYLNFSGLKNFDVTYRIIFPQGIALDAIDSLNKANVRKFGDGRYCLEVTFSASEANLTDEVTCKLIPSALFILGIFTPCIISLIIAIILIVVIIIVRKKRKGRKIKEPTIGEGEIEEEAGYEAEDYYIPPPPNSK